MIMIKNLYRVQQLQAVADPKNFEGGGAEDSPPSFIANKHSELYAFLREKANNGEGARSTTCQVHKNVR